MNQRETIRRIWDRRKKTLAPTPQAEEADAFFRLVEERTDMCWEELVEELRRNYPEAVDEVVSVLLETDDPLIVYNCIRFADESHPKEIAAMKRVARECDLERHQVSFLALANTGTKEVVPVLRARKNLPQALRAALNPAPIAAAAGKKKPRARKDE